MTVLTSFSSGRMPITLASLLVLSRITTLRTLKTEATYGVTDTGHFPPNAFPALRTFVLATAATHVVSDLLHAITSASLNNLDIAIKVMMPRDTVRDIFATLSERYPHLNNLRFAFTDVLNWHTQDVIPVSHLEPLLNLHELVEVDMAVCPVAVDDQLLRAISNSWRQLERLEMGVSYGMPQEAASVSLLGLAYLSHGCKQLVMVGLPLDVSDLSRLPAGIAALPFALGMRSTSPLAWLHVGRSPIEDPVSVAAYMSDICPNVMTISTHAVISADAGEDVDDWVRESNRRLLRWTGVQRLLEGFVRVRQQERRSMQSDGARCLVDEVTWDDTQTDVLGKVIGCEQVRRLVDAARSLTFWMKVIGGALGMDGSGEEALRGQVPLVIPLSDEEVTALVKDAMKKYASLRNASQDPVAHRDAITDILQVTGIHYFLHRCYPNPQCDHSKLLVAVVRLGSQTPEEALKYPEVSDLLHLLDSVISEDYVSVPIGPRPEHDGEIRSGIGLEGGRDQSPHRCHIGILKV
ncbi:hypothetical protein C8Q74DRAFT_1369240 [Fomes fomentarius]|nr:hypothetical protein C8Q74DRAFT_1369240 [Fomes fomentarius]